MAPGLFCRHPSPKIASRILRVLKQVFSSMTLSLIGRLSQFLGFVYVARCLEAAMGESSRALVWGQYLHFLLTLGMDVVAVRYLADGSRQLKEVLPALFTGRLILFLFSSLALVLIPWCLDGFSNASGYLWAAGGLNLLALGMNAQWAFQGLHRMPAFSLIQAGISIASMIAFYLFLRPGSVAGSDLWCMGLAQCLGAGFSWAYLMKNYRIQLFTKVWFPSMVAFWKEGLPNWIFGLIYNTLITFGMLTVRWLTRDQTAFSDHESVMGQLYRFTMAIHFILGYGGSVIYSRIVVWREESKLFQQKVMRVIGFVLAAGLGASAAIHWLHQPLYHWLFPAEIYQPGAPFVSWMVMGRFLALASGVLSWAMFAHRQDWLAVRCAIFPILIAVVLHLWIVPVHGFRGAVVLYLLGELGLFLCSLIGFYFMTRTLMLEKHEEPLTPRA